MTADKYFRLSSSRLPRRVLPMMFLLSSRAPDNCAHACTHARRTGHSGLFPGSRCGNVTNFYGLLRGENAPSDFPATRSKNSLARGFARKRIVDVKAPLPHFRSAEWLIRQEKCAVSRKSDGEWGRHSAAARGDHCNRTKTQTARTKNVTRISSLNENP